MLLIIIMVVLIYHVYNANTMLVLLHGHYPLSLGLFIYVPFQLPFRAYSAAAISALGVIVHIAIYVLPNN